MQFGDKNLFAIEIYLHQPQNRVFTSYCFWVKNNMVGDINETSVLESEIGIFENILANKNRRTISELSQYSASQVIQYLIDKTWEGEENNLLTKYTSNELEVLDINSHQGECFNGFYCFLMEADGYDWLLCKDSITNKIIDAKIPKDEFYKYVKSTLNWIKSSIHYVLNERSV